MVSLPLTHHDIVRIADPLTRLGLKVNLALSNRASGYIEFVSRPGHENAAVIVYVLEVTESNEYTLSRVAAHQSGLVSTLQCRHRDLPSAYTSIEQVPLARQMMIHPCFELAHSFEVEPVSNNANKLINIRSRFVCAQVASLEIRLDTSMGAGMPADVRIMSKGQSSSYIRDTLADGGHIPLNHKAAQATRRHALDNTVAEPMPSLPDDILAILGTQWRPLRFQGDHWKGVLRQIEKPATRTQRIEKFVDEALKHLAQTLQSAPTQYHATHLKQRWQVYVRRLQPVMLFVGILLLMPMSWFFVSSGAVTIHPLALGLTPLLMVGVVVLTAREIPVMEIPQRPSELPDSAWTAKKANE